ncbi:hypothetical protein Pd630_LPD05973 [Rhodococcus opacus PD630]|nr:hypothetical protein Pd630_LPD05973 [Rhodococcus opacus PD630]
MRAIPRATVEMCTVRDGDDAEPGVDGGNRRTVMSPILKSR